MATDAEVEAAARAMFDALVKSDERGVITAFDHNDGSGKYAEPTTLDGKFDLREAARAALQAVEAVRAD